MNNVSWNMIIGSANQIALILSWNMNNQLNYVSMDLLQFDLWNPYRIKLIYKYVGKSRVKLILNLYTVQSILIVSWNIALCGR